MAEATLKMLLLGEDRSAGKTLRNVAGDADRASGKFGGLAKAGGAALAAGFAIGGAALIKFGGDAISAASDMNETLSKSRVIFGQNSRAMEKWASGAAKAAGLSKQAALESAAGFGDMFSQLGFTTEAAAKMSKEVVQMSADLGSFNNLPTAEVTDMMSAAFRGEYDSLQRVIPNINAARVETEALAMTGKESAKQLTAQEKAAATLAIVQKDGARATGDFARTSDGLANQQKILSAEFDNVKASIGKGLLPVATALTAWVTREGLPKFKEFGAWFKANLAPQLKELGEKVMKGLKDAFEQFKKALQDARPALELYGNYIKNVLWPVLKTLIAVTLPALGIAFRAIGKALGAIGTAGTVMWNTILAPVLRLMLGAIAGIMDAAGSLMKTLGKAPGFGWAKKLGQDLKDGADKARGLRDGINNIPTKKDVKVNVKKGSGWGLFDTLAQLGANLTVKANAPRTGDGTRSYSNFTTSSRTSQIIIQGAIDPASTARQIRTILNNDGVNTGQVVTV